MLSQTITWQDELKTALRSNEELEAFFETSFAIVDLPLPAGPSMAIIIYKIASLFFFAASS